MSSEFNAEAYVEKWDKVIVPAMLLVIFLALLGAFGLQFAVDKDCSQNRFTYCGETPAHQIKSHSDH